MSQNIDILLATYYHDKTNYGFRLKHLIVFGFFIQRAYYYFICDQLYAAAMY